MSISAEAVRFDENSMWVELSDGRPLAFHWRGFRVCAKPNQRIFNNMSCHRMAFIGMHSTRMFQSQACLQGREI